MACEDNSMSLNLRDISIKSFSEKLRNMNRYSALKELEKYYGLLSFKIAKAPFLDVVHFITTLSLIDHEATIRFILDNRDKLSRKLLEADYLEVKEFILAPYRVNRIMGTFIVTEFEDELKKYLLKNIDNFSLLTHGLIISSVSRCSEKVAEKLINLNNTISKICDSIESEDFGRDDLERIGSFFCSLMLGSKRLAEEVSSICEESIINRFEKEFKQASFEELGVFLSCVSRSNPRIREKIIEKYKAELEDIFNNGIGKYSISDIRVMLEGVSFTDPNWGFKLYKEHRDRILRYLIEAGDDKIYRFLQTMRKANKKIYEELKATLSTLTERKSP